MLSKIKIVHIDKTSSTQDAVKDDDWNSPEGGFWATLGMSTSLNFNYSQLALFHYFTAILLTRVIKEEYNIIIQIKWPNDLLYDNKKLAGILIDYIVGTQKNYLLIGMGVNLNNSSHEMQNNLKSITISIKDIIKKTVSLDDFAHQIRSQADHYFSPIIENNQKVIQHLIQEYNQYSRIYGKEVILDDSKRYFCNGINQEGVMQFRKGENALNLKIDDLTRIKKIISS